MTRLSSIEQIFTAGSNGDSVARTIMGLLLYEARKADAGKALLKEMSDKGVIWASDMLATISREESPNHIRYMTGLTVSAEKQLVSYVTRDQNIYAMTVIGLLKLRQNDSSQQSVGKEYLDAAKTAGCLWAEDLQMPTPAHRYAFESGHPFEHLRNRVPQPSESDIVNIVSKKYGY